MLVWSSMRLTVTRSTWLLGGLLFLAASKAEATPLSQRLSEYAPPEPNGLTAWESRRPLADLDLSGIPELSSRERLNELFFRIRNAQGWLWAQMPDFPRRLTWLYPADGCYLRTSHMQEKFGEWKAPAPAHFFAFGSLSFSTPYETVSWWYHVAPAYRVGRQVYIVDPAIDFRAPSTLEDWILRLNPEDPEAARFVVCASGAVSPPDNCFSAESEWDPVDRSETLQYYLAQEWFQLETFLGESPDSVLGPSPPWVGQATARSLPAEASVSSFSIPRSFSRNSPES